MRENLYYYYYFYSSVSSLVAFDKRGEEKGVGLAVYLTKLTISIISP